MLTTRPPKPLSYKVHKIIQISKYFQRLAKYMLQIVRSIVTQQGQNTPQSQFCGKIIQIGDILVSTHSGVHNKFKKNSLYERYVSTFILYERHVCLSIPYLLQNYQYLHRSTNMVFLKIFITQIVYVECTGFYH
jgi:hypothetical protein